MPDDTLIDSLLSVWEAAAIKPRLEDLCRSCPELLEPLRARVAALQAADRLLNSDLFAAPTTASDSIGPSIVESCNSPGAREASPKTSPTFPQIDDYQILRELGGGGQARVYLALYRQHITRTVKVFRDQGAAPTCTTYTLFVSNG